MEIQVRPALQEDMMTIFKWSNDPLTRRMSFSQGSINLEEHKIWYNSLLNFINPQLFIVECLLEEHWIPISQMRVDDKGIISYSLSLDYRGKGNGAQVLNKCIEYIRENLMYKEIIAFIKHDNAPSIKSFEMVGFTLEGEDVIKGNACLRYKLVF